jgi:hypothetical protein
MRVSSAPPSVGTGDKACRNWDDGSGSARTAGGRAEEKVRSVVRFVKSWTRNRGYMQNLGARLVIAIQSRGNFAYIRIAINSGGLLQSFRGHIANVSGQP